MRKFLALLIVLPLLGMSKTPKILTRDIVYLKNGEEIMGSVVKITGDSLLILTGHGNVKLARGAVLSIESSKRRPGDMWEKVSDIKDTLLLRALKINVDSIFPSAGYVNIFVRKSFKLKNGNYEYTERRIIKILKERGKRAANRFFRYHHRYEKGEIVFARTVTKDGRVVSILDNAIEDASVFSNYPDYDDLHRIKFAIPEGEPGNILDYEIKITGKSSGKHPALKRILMGDNDPTYEEIVSISGPALIIKTENSENLKADTLQSGGVVFTLRNHPGYIREPHIPPLHYILPAITVAERAGLDYYRAYLDTLLANFDAEKLIDSLASRALTLEDSVFALYRFVAQSINRVPADGNSFSMFPKAPGDVIKNSMGSEIDKAFLLYAILKKDGLSPELILTTSKDLWHTYPDIQNISQFSGIIVKLDSAYLDPVNDRMPLGYVRPEYQGTRGITLDGRAVEIPFIPYEREGETNFMNITLTNTGDLLVSDKYLYRGEDGVMVRSLKQYRKVELEKLLEQSVNWAPGTILDSFSLSDLQDLRIPPRISLYYHIPEYAIVANDLILLKMPDLTEYTASDVGATERFNPLYFSRNYRRIKDIVINLPPGYMVRYIPEGFKGRVKFMSFNSLLFKDSGKVHYSDETIRFGGIYDKSLYPAYRKIVEGMARLRDNYIVLQRMKR